MSTVLGTDTFGRQLNPFTARNRHSRSESPPARSTSSLSLSRSPIDQLVHAVTSSYGSQLSAEVSSILQALVALCQGQKTSRLRWLLASVLSMAPRGHLPSLDRLVRSEPLLPLGRKLTSCLETASNLAKSRRVVRLLANVCSRDRNQCVLLSHSSLEVVLTLLCISEPAEFSLYTFAH